MGARHLLGWPPHNRPVSWFRLVAGAIAPALLRGQLRPLRRPQFDQMLCDCRGIGLRLSDSLQRLHEYAGAARDLEERLIAVYGLRVFMTSRT